MQCNLDVPLQDAVKLRTYKAKVPFSYVLKFTDNSRYIGSASGVYRLGYYRSVARGTYPSLTKNPLLINALLTMPCTVDIIWCATLEEARLREKALWIEATAAGVKLRNCREFGHAGRWIQQDATTQAKRLDALRLNGRSSLLNAAKLPNGKSRAAVKGVISRALSKSQELRSLKNLDSELLAGLMLELGD